MEPVYFLLRKTAVQCSGNSRDDSGSSAGGPCEGLEHTLTGGAVEGSAPARETELGFKDDSSLCRHSREKNGKQGTAPLS